MPNAADEVIMPDGRRAKVTGGETFNDATSPGVYRVVANGKVIGAFVVNPARSESDLRYANESFTKKALAGMTVVTVDDADDWASKVYGSRVGREIWRAVLLMLLVLLCVEGVAAATGGRSDLDLARAAQPNIQTER
jgi:hypothetical protein